MIGALRHINQRREALQSAIDVKTHFKTFEETCVPSYCHSNAAAAYMSWWRLFKSVRLAQDSVETSNDITRVLDFGASVGELGHLIPDWEYHYIESIEAAVKQLQTFLPSAIREELDNCNDNYFDIIFALDSLEHNQDYTAILDILIGKLKLSGILIVSGPTESSLYRLGRKLVGFQGHYHETNVYKIENKCAQIMDKISIHSLPIVAPLFRISIWRR